MTCETLKTAVRDTVGFFMSAAACGESISPATYEEHRAKTEAAFADLETEIIALREMVALQEMTCDFYQRSFRKLQDVVAEDNPVKPWETCAQPSTCHHVWCICARVLRVTLPEMKVHKRARRARVAIASAKKLLEQMYVPVSLCEEALFVRERIKEYEEVR